MNPVTSLLRRLGRPGPRAEDSLGADGERALRSHLARLRLIDPNTEGQWQLLKPSLSRGEAVPRAPAGIRAWRPALAVGLAGAGILLVLLWSPNEPSHTEHATGRGQQATVTLADSTQITLNHTSRLLVGSGGDFRVVSLEGEAYFRVRKTGAPFVVETELGAVRVLGTQFNVRVRDNHLEVAVVSGSVRVTSVGSGGEVVLKAGELTRCTRTEGPDKAMPLHAGEYPLWLHGRLFFDRATLAEACREIEDFFDVTVTIRASGQHSQTFTGAVDARTPETALSTLARLSGRNYRHDQSGYLLY
jgi:transmembrane sensor